MHGLIRANVLCWARWLFSGYLWPQHIRLIAKYLARIESGDCTRLIIEAPPRHGKSFLTSIAFPSWYIARNPDKRVIAVSHTSTLASHNGRLVRNALASHGPRLFGVTIARDSSAADRWGIEGHSGGFLAAGVGGGLTGFGADCILIDDPIKDAEAAYSAKQRDAVWEWYGMVARTRLQPGGSIVVIITRWHEDDLCGRLLRDNIENWEVLRMPAIAEDNDILGREPGAALWPEMFDSDALNAVRMQIGSYAWNALYQQRPVAESGAIIKREWIKHYDELPVRPHEFVLSCDMTFKESGSSYVVMQVWARYGTKYYLADQIRKRLGFVDTVEHLSAMCKKWPQCRTKLIEDKANGPAIIDAVRKTIDGVIAVTPKESKQARLHAVEPMFEAGDVLIPQPDAVDWVPAYIDELVSFPKSAYDDQVDATTMALHRYKKQASTSLMLDIGGVNIRPSPWRL